MVTRLRRVLMKRPEQAFQSQDIVQQQWKNFGYSRPLDLLQASREHDHLVSLLTAADVEVLCLPADDRTGLDSIYTHDPVLMTDSGAIILQTGKLTRRGEGPAVCEALKGWGVPILGTMQGTATAEAGDMIWLDQHTLIVGRGFRTNAAGIDALSEMLYPAGIHLIPLHLPYWNGPHEVLHLMSFISLIDDDLAVVYRQLVPVPLFELLIERDVELVDVPDDEYHTLGCNVLAVSPRNVIMVSGNPITRSRLEAAGCQVSEFEGKEICFPGAGGPTCLTRPLWRSQAKPMESSTS